MTDIPFGLSEYLYYDDELNDLSSALEYTKLSFQLFKIQHSWADGNFSIHLPTYINALSSKPKDTQFKNE